MHPGKLALPTELLALIAAAVLYWLLAQIAALGKIARAGVGWGIGNREQEAPIDPWVGRTLKAQSNLGESLPMFFALVLAVMVTGHSNPTTQLASLAFLGARAAHAGVFMAGITLWRTVAYYAGLSALVVMFWQLLG